MKKFLIVGTQRTGSSALGEAIGLHSDVTCGWEWTESVPRRNKIILAQQALGGDFSSLLPEDQEHMSNQFNPDASWLGFRRLFGASNKWIVHPRYSLKLWWDRMEDHINWLRNSPDIHIIHIVRHNNLEWLKSKWVAAKASSFVGETYPKDIKVKIPVKEAISRLRSKAWIDHRLATLANSNPYLLLSYEDMSEHLDDMVISMFEFLHCNPDDVQDKGRVIQKQSTKSLENYIENYNELVAQLDRLDLLVYKFS